MERGVLNTNAPNDFSIANQGQAKQIAQQAYLEFNDKLGGASPAISNLVSSFSNTDNYSVLNQGQLKNVGVSFYDQLNDLHLTNAWPQGMTVGPYPWSGSTQAPQDYAAANVGQLKYIFSFDLDHDSDGLPDWWEEHYGMLNPLDDEDDDGWTNVQEYQRGTDPLLANVFVVPPNENILIGDGSTNPPEGDVIQVLALSGSSVSATTGTWVQEGSALYAAGRRGGLTYSVELPQNDIYRLQFEVRQQKVVSAKSYTYFLRFSVDGEFVARRSVILVGSGIQTVAVDTPFLNAGVHTVEVCWDNYESGISLRVEQLKVQQYSGNDGNSNGIKDWVENRLMARNTIDVAPTASQTSPVCLEGRSLFAGTMQVSGVDRVFHGANDRWFANRPLAEDGTPTDVAVRCENGGRVLSRQVRWKETNLLKDGCGDMVIRCGDALRLTAFLSNMVSGTAEIQVNGQSLGSGPIQSAKIFRFEQDGLYTLSAIASGLDAAGHPVSDSRTVTLRVLRASPETVAAQVNQRRNWVRPESWPAEAVVEWDNRLQRTVTNGSLWVKTTTPEELYGVVRLGTNGPVLAPVIVKGFNLWLMRNTYLHYTEVYADGSFKAQTTQIMSPVIPEVRISQHCRGIVAYEDGSRVHDLFSRDFDRIGEVTVLFYHSSPIATSVCIYTDVYQGDELIARDY